MSQLASLRSTEDQSSFPEALHTAREGPQDTKVRTFFSGAAPPPSTTPAAVLEARGKANGRAGCTFLIALCGVAISAAERLRISSIGDVESVRMGKNDSNPGDRATDQPVAGEDATDMPRAQRRAHPHASHPMTTEGNTPTHSPLQADARPHQGGVAVDMNAEEGKRQQQFALRHDTRSTDERADSVRVGLMRFVGGRVSAGKQGKSLSVVVCGCCSLRCVSYKQ